MEAIDRSFSADLAPRLTQAETLVVLSTAKAAGLLGLQSQTMRLMRSRGDGPPFIKTGPVNGRCMYLRTDIEEWLQSRRHSNTSELSAVPPVRRGRKPARRS